VYGRVVRVPTLSAIVEGEEEVAPAVAPATALAAAVSVAAATAAASATAVAATASVTAAVATASMTAVAATTTAAAAAAAGIPRPSSFKGRGVRKVVTGGRGVAGGDTARLALFAAAAGA